jgi:phospholipid/cholesterol/gamma-HCH transport system substrate-binding protein
MRRAKRTHLATVIGGVTFLAAVLVGLMFWAGFWTLGKTYDVSVFVPNARGLAPEAHVMIAGLEVGKVTSIQRNGPNAILGMRIDSGPTPLPQDSRVAVRLRSLAGESYVEVYPGRSAATVRSGGSLAIAQSNPYVDVDQILQALSGSTQDRARQTIQALGGAVGDRGPQLNQVVGSAAGLISDSVPLTSTLAAQHNQVADLVQNLGNVMSAIGQRTTAVMQFASGARRTFASLAARDVALHNTLDKLPYFLGSLKRISLDVNTITPHVAPLALNLTSALQELSPAIHLLTPASRSGVRLLQGVGAASYPLRGVLQNLVQLQKPTTAALPQLHATLCQLDPILRYTAPYGPDASAFLQNFGSAGNSYDATGHAPRAYADVTPAAAGAVLPSSAGTLVTALENFGIGRNLIIAGYNPFPAPGQAGATVVGRGASGPESAGKLIKYPRVTADCAQ